MQELLMKVPKLLYTRVMPIPKCNRIDIKEKKYTAIIKEGKSFNLTVENDESLILFTPVNKGEVFLYIRKQKDDKRTAKAFSYMDLDFMLRSKDNVLQSFEILNERHFRANLFQIVSQNGDDLTLKKVDVNTPSALDTYSDNFGRFNAMMSAFVSGPIGTCGQLDEYLRAATSSSVDNMIGLLNGEGVHTAIARNQARVDEIIFSKKIGSPSLNTLSSIYTPSVIMGGFIGECSGIGFPLGVLSSQFGVLGAAGLGLLRSALNYDNDEVVNPAIGGVVTALATAILARYIYNGGNFLRSGPQDAKTFKAYHLSGVKYFIGEHCVSP